MSITLPSTYFGETGAFMKYISNLLVLVQVFYKGNNMLKYFIFTDLEEN